MESKQLETQKAIVALFNQYEFLMPKLNQFNELINGRALKQILAYILDDPINIDQIDDDNWAICLKNIKDIIVILSKTITDKSIHIDAIKISKNEDMQELLLLVQWVLLAIIKSEKSQELIQPMMNLPQGQQIQMAQLMNQLMNDGKQQDDSDEPKHFINDQVDVQKSEQFLKELERLESDNKDLRSSLKSQIQYSEQEKSQLMSRLELMSSENEQIDQLLKKKEYELNDIFDKFSVQSSNELIQYIFSKDHDINTLQKTIKDMSAEMKLMKQNGDEIIQSLRGDLEKQTKKSSVVPKLERQIQQLKQDLEESQLKVKSLLEIEKERQGLQNQIEDFSSKLKQSQEKQIKQKNQSKDERQRIAALEFDLQKLRAESTSQIRQITLKEQEIYQYQNEIADLENALDRMQHQDNSHLLNESQQNSFIDKSNNIANILSPKRNLGYELSQVMNRSMNSLNWEQNDGWKNNYRPDSGRHINIESNKQYDDNLILRNFESEQQESLPQIDENVVRSARAVKPSTSDDEDLQVAVDFWKTKCNLLQIELTDKEQKYKTVEDHSGHLQLKLEKFFKEQIRYEDELLNTRNLLQKHFADNEGQNKQIIIIKQQMQEFQEEKSNLLEKINMLEQTKHTHLTRIAQFDQYMLDCKRKKEDRALKKKVSSIQILEKQLKITKRSYEEALIQKDEELQLLLSLLIDMATRVESDQQKLLIDKIQQNFNILVMLSQPK